MSQPFEKVNNNRSSISDFTNDQAKAYKELIDFINKPYNEKDYKRALVGPAGTGKTYLVKSLITNCNLSHSAIGLAAPTHKACRVLKESIGINEKNINTLQSDLGLKLNFSIENFDINNPPFDPMGKVNINSYQLYIIDESSMINKGLVTFLERVCKNNNCKILYIGDDYQLPPVNEKQSSAFKGVKVCRLTENVRQGEDNPISYLLDLLRYDIKHNTYCFIEYISKNKFKFNSDNTKGYTVCNVNQFTDYVFTNYNNQEYTENISLLKTVAYTNERVSFWNKLIRNVIIKDADKNIITKNDLITSYINIVNDFNGIILKNSEEYIIKDIVNYNHPKYGLKGYMIIFKAIYGGADTTPLFVLDSSNRINLIKYIQLYDELVNNAKNASNNQRSRLWKEFFKFKEDCLVIVDVKNTITNELKLKRTIDYGFAISVHKSQGSTFENVFVDINNIVFDKNGNTRSNAEEINKCLYVACSRAKNKLYLCYGK